MKRVLECIKEEGIKTIKLWFTDILGKVKGFDLSVREIERAFEEGIIFDGSSVEGFVRIEESDLIAKPDPDSFFIIPEEVNGEKTLVIICDVQYPDGTPYDSCPRHVLKRNLKYAKNMGFEFFIGPELEYFYFPDEKKAIPLDEAGYFEVFPYDEPERAKRETLHIFEKMGIRVESTHHEVAYSQHEIDFRYENALKMADILQVAKIIIKQVARKYKIYATFMPKPIFGINGSGLHCHQSLFKEGKNAFYDKDDKYNLSKIAKCYMAGLLEHSREITAITNQWVNSYKRLVVGYEAPVYLAWGRKNRSALIRVPAFKPYKPESCRIEYRAPDPACNPYLAFSCMLRAGLKGIEKEYILREPIEEDIYAMPEEVKRKYGIDALPDSLYSAIILMEKSELVKDTLGENLFDKFIKNKKTEWEKYRIQITDYEIENYLPIL
jgi:glutamine synthetase